MLGLLLLLSTPLALADLFDSLYIAQDIGRSKFNNVCSGISPVYTSCKDFDFSHRTSVGLLVADFTNAELGYYSSGQATKKGSGSNYDAIDSVEWQLSGIRYLPIGDGRLNVFARAGILHWEQSEANATKRINTSGNSLLLGVGGKFFVTKFTAVRVQLETHRIGSGGVLFMGTGITYQFL